MNKNLFVIFLLAVSSDLCASNQPVMYFDHPGGNPVTVPPSSYYEAKVVVDPSDPVWFLVPSQSSSSFSTPSSSPEQTRRADDRQKAVIIALNSAGSKQ